jgi:hypothetical protein
VRYRARTGAVGLRLHKRQAPGVGVYPQQAPTLDDASGYLEPAAGVDPRIERQLDVVALILAARAQVRHPQRGVGRAEHEIVPALRRSIRQVAEQVASGELAGHRDLLVEIA